jgi:thymidylate synthase
MQAYRNLVNEVINNGELKSNRTGIDSISITSSMIKCDLREGFPLLTSRKLPIKSTMTELEFFIHGITDKKWLQDRKCKFWDGWCNPEKVAYSNKQETIDLMASERDLGEVYGYVWNYWKVDESIVTVEKKVTRTEPYTIELDSTIYNDRVKKLYGESIFNELILYWKYLTKNKLIDNSWISLQTFIDDVVTLPNWVAKLRYPDQYTLSNIYYNADIYNKETAMWLHNRDITIYNTMKPVKIIYDDAEYLYIDHYKASLDFNIMIDTINNVSIKKNHECIIHDYNSMFNIHKNIVIKSINDDKLYRYRLPINQLKTAINTLKTNYMDRRMIVSAWNPGLLHKQALPPCHYVFELLSDGKNVDLIFKMRSSDVGLGLPANLASYAMLLMLIAEEVSMTPRYLVYVGGDVHIYKNHLEQMKELLKRDSKKLPKMKILRHKQNWSIYDWNSQTDWELIEYDPHPPIKMDVAI